MNNFGMLPTFYYLGKYPTTSQSLLIFFCCLRTWLFRIILGHHGLNLLIFAELITINLQLAVLLCNSDMVDSLSDLIESEMAAFDSVSSAVCHKGPE